MWNETHDHHPGWRRQRLSRQMASLISLAVPAMMMRLGILALGMVDTAFVGHYATEHLAWLNLANQSVIMFALVVGLGLLMGILVFTSAAYGEGNFEECGRVWRRSLPYTLGAGLFIVLLSLPAESLLLWTGQQPKVAAESGELIKILALGLPAHLLFVNCTMFLEGVKRAGVGLMVMIIANGVNLVLDYGLIYGMWGLPEMGATGSAITTTTVRWVMAISILSYVWFSPTMQKFGVRNKHGQKWSDWAEQRSVGFASAVSLAAEVAAFSALVIYGGWLGTIPLAAQGVVSQLIGLPLMMAVGLGVAGSVRVGIAFARRDRLDTRMAAGSALILHLVLIGSLSIAVVMLTGSLIGIFTSDIRIIEILLPLAPLFAATMFFDGAQIVISCLLRGMKEKWVPTGLCAISFTLFMLPLCYYLAFPLGLGLEGLILGTLAGCILSFFTQTWRFFTLTQKSRVRLLISLKD